MAERPIDKWRQKLEFLQLEEAKASDPAQKFKLQEDIEEAKRKIAEFEGALSDQQTQLSAERLVELTNFAYEQLAAAAKVWLDNECAPFIVPSLARHRMQHESAQMMGPSRQRHPLEEGEIETLVLGQLPPSAIVPS